MSTDQIKPLMVVTGGSKGVGANLVKFFSENGWRVVFTYASSKQAAKELEEQAENQGFDVYGFQCDGSNADAVADFAKNVLTEFGTPQALVNNAGITHDQLMISMDRAGWEQVIDTNLNSSFYMTRNFLPALVEQGNCSVVMMTSVSGFKGNKGQTNYGASKAGLIGLTKSLAQEVARFGVRVNAVAPGFIVTEMTDKIPEKEIKGISKLIPMRKMGTTEDVAHAVDFLVGSHSRYITGQVLVVDGGLTS